MKRRNNQKDEKNNNISVRPEILAPAGDLDGVIAAINAGCDAVYFGGKICNARQRAHNFDDDAMRHAIHLCHEHSVKAYLTVNTLIKDDEWPEIAAYCKMLDHSGIDGLIVQDPGLIWYLRRQYPDLSLQTSTQASVGGLPGVLFFESLGFDRVVLPREMPIDEVRAIRKQTHVELKIFAHGALCYCRSGQCLMSSLIGGRSGNRGLCAQPCRKQYTLFDVDGKRLKSGYLLSMKDLNVANHVKEITDAGVDALKIEGRMRDTAYIYAVTKYYREAFEALDDPTLHRTITENDLDAIFSRDFTPGWLFQKQHHINQTVQKKRGERIGTVKSCRHHQAVLQLNRGVTLHVKDGLAFGEDAHVGLQVDAIEKAGAQTVKVPTRLSLSKGMPVFRNKNAALIAAITDAAEKPLDFKALPIDLTLSIEQGKPIDYTWRCDGRQGSGTAPIVAEAAQKHALTEEMVTEQLAKLGGTDYVLKNITLTLGDHLFLSKKDLNALRRQIVSEIDGESGDAAFELPDSLLSEKHQPKISIQISRLSDDIIHLDADEFVLPWRSSSDNDALATALDVIHANYHQVKIALPEIINTEKARELADNRAFLDKLHPDGYLIRNYEALYLLRGGVVPLEADANLHLFSSMTCTALHDWGCASGVISRELDGASMASILKHAAMPCVVTVYGYQEVMLSDNCVINCKAKRCDDCPNAGRYMLRDKSGARFPLTLGRDGMTRIYNSDKLRLTDKELSRLSGAAAYRIDVLNESPDEIAAVIDVYRHGGHFHETAAKERFTVGNFYRGVQ